MLYRRRGVKNNGENSRKDKVGVFIAGKIAILLYFNPFWEEEEERERGKTITRYCLRAQIIIITTTTILDLHRH